MGEISRTPAMAIHLSDWPDWAMTRTVTRTPEPG